MSAAVVTVVVMLVVAVVTVFVHVEAHRLYHVGTQYGCSIYLLDVILLDVIGPICV